MTRWLQLSAQAGSSLADFSALKMEAIHSSETSVHTRATVGHIPEDGILQIYEGWNVVIRRRGPIPPPLLLSFSLILYIMYSTGLTKATPAPQA
jgi:hypothetical protein